VIPLSDDDLVTRLQGHEMPHIYDSQCAVCASNRHDLAAEAAARITELEAALAREKNAAWELAAQCATRQAENARLRETLLWAAALSGEPTP
jgi:hypothetical protein